MQVLRGADAARTRWRNDGGWTREILREPATGDGPFGWRVSIAEVESDGPFSAFDGYDRVLVLLAGDGMDLHFTDTGSTVHLRPHSRLVRFAGEAPVHAALVDGPTTDFNLIWRRDLFDVSVLAHLPMTEPPIVADGVRLGVYVIDGVVQSQRGVIGGPGDTVVGEEGEVLQIRCTGRSIHFQVAPRQ